MHASTGFPQWQVTQCVCEFSGGGQYILNVLYVMYDLRITYGRHFGALLPFHWPNGHKAKDQKILERILVVSV